MEDSKDLLRHIANCMQNMQLWKIESVVIVLNDGETITMAPKEFTNMFGCNNNISICIEKGNDLVYIPCNRITSVKIIRKSFG